MGPLSLRILARLGAVLLVVGLAVVALAQVQALRPLLFGVEGLLLVAALAVVGAAAVLQPLLIRIETLDVALAATGDVHAAPLRLPGAHAQGDELARLAARLETLSAQASQQAQALAVSQAQQRTLIANVSHDLRTPLAAIQGYLELLLLRPAQLDEREARHHLQTAIAQCERLTRLVSDLFELSRLESGDAEMQAEPFPLAELAQDVVQKFAAAAQQREISLAMRCADGAMVEADLGLIAGVLDRLVDHALRHTPAGGSVTLAIADDGERARLSVSDTGDGSAADRLPDLLAHYEHGTRTGPAGANGHADLGLAIVQRIVALHGSQLQIDSRRGEGTQVRFDLARARPRRNDLPHDTRT
jgi:signal transduction histidine kinase